MLDSREPCCRYDCWRDVRLLRLVIHRTRRVDATTNIRGISSSCVAPTTRDAQNDPTCWPNPRGFHGATTTARAGPTDLSWSETGHTEGAHREELGSGGIRHVRYAGSVREGRLLLQGSRHGGHRRSTHLHQQQTSTLLFPGVEKR